MKSRTNIRLALTAIITTLSTSGCIAMTNGLNDATVRIRVIDEESRPIQGVYADYYSLSDDDSKPGLTDTNGMYSVRLNNIYYSISGHFTKSGYYKSSGRLWHWKEWGGVPPANTNFTIVMKRIVDPVPMVRKHIGRYLPRINEPMGFDFEIGDFVAPHGKGKVSDVLMTPFYFYESQDKREAKITVEFASELCGIQNFVAMKSNPKTPIKSELMPPHTAPDEGYEQTLSLFRISDGSYYPKTHEIEDRNYLFRTRVVVNDDGEIIKANYGWTVGDIIVEAHKDNQIWLRFSYYYNPNPNSKSLEPKEIADRQAKE